MENMQNRSPQQWIIPDSKWMCRRNEEDGKRSFLYNGVNVPLNEDSEKVLMKKGKNMPLYIKYIKSLDSLFFGDNLILSPYGMIKLPEGIKLFLPIVNMHEEIKCTIFVVTDGKNRNFMSIRNGRNGDIQWEYLFSDWAHGTTIEPVGTEVKLSLIKKGHPIAELLLPKFARKENIESKDEFFTDPRDNKKYRIVKIGSQIWMADNLNWEGAGVTYENKKSNGKKYGRLYTWDEAMKAAPLGWHLPTDEEWTALADYVGGAYDTLPYGMYAAAEALKSEDWDGTDAFGFSALPGGCGDRNNDFSFVGDYGRWWTATKMREDGQDAFYLEMGTHDSWVSMSSCCMSNNHQKFSYSVRLVRD